MVDNLNGFLEAIYSNASEYLELKDFIDEIFCPSCGDLRKYNFKRYFGSNIPKDVSRISVQYLPVIYKGSCRQCEATVLLILYQGPESLELAVLHDTYGGCVTPNAPIEVKYYIDQAFRARSLGALSAAMAMYRSALEWVLYNQGYKKGMLAQKINELEKAKKDDNAPKWAKEIASEFLEAIKRLGNGAMHTNDGDIIKQKEIDKALIEVVDIVFAELLDKIYEQPIRSANNLAKLQSTATKIETP